MTNQTDPRALLSFIRSAETSRGYEDYSRFAVIPPSRPVSQMTIGEVREWQRRNARAGAKSTAIGGYQFIGKTFNATVDALRLSDDTPFNEATQDAMAMHLLRGRGYNGWRDGRISDEQFIDNLAQEWAAIPRATGTNRGRSHYAGDGLNANTRNLDQVFEALGASRSGDWRDFAQTATREVQDTPRPTQGRDWNPEENFLGRDTSQFRTPGPAFMTRQDEAFIASQPSERIGFGEAAYLAGRDEWSAAYAYRAIAGETFEPDPEFQQNGLTKERLDELVGHLPPVYQEALSAAVSEAHAAAISQQMNREWEVQQKLGELGWGGVALRLGAAMTDPVALGLSLVTGGLAAPWLYGAKASRGARILAGGTSSAAVNAAVEGYIATQDPARGFDGVIYAAAAGALLGGAISGVGRSPMAREAARMDQAALRAVQREIAELNDGSLSAARIQTDPNLTPAQQVMQRFSDAPRAAMERFRFDVTGRLMSSDIGIVRKLGSMMAEDAIGRADGSASVISATERVQRDLRIRMSRFYREATPAYKDWLKRNNRSIFSLRARAEFYDQVGRAVRRPLDADGDPSVNAVAGRLKAEFADLLEFAKSKGIKGFDQVAENSNYLMRQHNLKRLDELTAQWGGGNVTELYARSFVSGSRKDAMKRGLGEDAVLDYEDALRLSAAYLKSIRNRRYGVTDQNMAFAGHDLDKLGDVMRESIGRIEVAGGKSIDLTDADINRILTNLREETRANPEEAGRIGRAKYRVRLDEEYGHEMALPDGRKVWVGIEDTLENNAETIFQQYTRQVTGQGHMQDILREFRTVDADGNLSETPSWETVKGYIRQEQRDRGLGTGGKLDDDFKRLDMLHNVITGRPTFEHTRGTEVLRWMRDYNFLRVAGQMGLASIPELGNAASVGGVRNFINHIPEFRRMWAGARSGKFDNAYAREIEEVFGSGTDPITRSPGFITEDYQLGGGGVIGGQGARQVDYAGQQLKEVMSAVSGLDHINMGLQRFATRMAVQRFMDMAKRGGKMTTSRLRQLGLDDATSDRVFAQMRAHVGEERGIFGGRVNALNLENWTDQTARSAFVDAVDRLGKATAMVQDPGTLPAFMTSSPVARSVFQFRSFMMSAYHKMLLAGLHHRDIQTATTFLYTTFFASLGYIGQTHINLIGHPDRDKQLEDRLDPTQIGLAAFQRSGYSTFLPMVVDSFITGAGEDPVFTFRTTGLASGFLGNPTVDLLDNTMRSVRGAANAVRTDRDFSQDDWRAVSSIYPFQNALLFRHVNQIIADELPRR
jgi:hypothetical protein